MGLSNREKADLDNWLTREPFEEESMFCTVCGVDSNDCVKPDEHEEKWISWKQQSREEYEDWYHDWKNDN